MHVWQYLTLTTIPLTKTSFMGGKLEPPPWIAGQSVEIVEPSSSGGWRLRGIIPGSWEDVMNRRNITWISCPKKKNLSNLIKKVAGLKDVNERTASIKVYAIVWLGRFSLITIIKFDAWLVIHHFPIYKLKTTIKWKTRLLHLSQL